MYFKLKHQSVIIVMRAAADTEHFKCQKQLSQCCDVFQLIFSPKNICKGLSNVHDRLYIMRCVTGNFCYIPHIDTMTTSPDELKLSVINGVQKE